MRLTSVAALSLATAITSSLAVLTPLDAQRPRRDAPPPQPPQGVRPAVPRSGTLSGTLSPRAIGRPAPRPTPIGGLQTRPLNAPRPVGAGTGLRGRDGSVDRFQRGDRDRDRNGSRYGDRNRNDDRRGQPPRVYGPRSYPFGYGLVVADAPLTRGGVIYYDERAADQRVEIRPAQPAWFPTVDKPRWRRDTSVTAVQAWVDLLVNDIVCDGYGTCIERERRTRAPWVAPCRCYVFTDAIGRRWEIGTGIER